MSERSDRERSDTNQLVRKYRTDKLSIKYSVFILLLCFLFGLFWRISNLKQFDHSKAKFQWFLCELYYICRSCNVIVQVRVVLKRAVVARGVAWIFQRGGGGGKVTLGQTISSWRFRHEIL